MYDNFYYMYNTQNIYNTQKKNTQNIHNFNENL